MLLKNNIQHSMLDNIDSQKYLYTSFTKHFCLQLCEYFGSVLSIHVLYFILNI